MTEMYERIIALLEQERYQWESNCIGEEHRANRLTEELQRVTRQVSKQVFKLCTPCAHGECGGNEDPCNSCSLNGGESDNWQPDHSGEERTEEMSETSEITGPLIKALNQTGGWAERMNSGKAKRGKYFITPHGEGTADILFFPREIAPFYSDRVPPPVWIKTKQPKGHTNPEQVKAQAAFKEKVEALGHRYICVVSVAEGLEAVL